MTQRQPSLTEASKLLERGWLGPDWVPYAKDKRGCTANYIARLRPIASDITERCFDCKRVIVDRRDQLVKYVAGCTCKEGQIQGRWKNYKCDCPSWPDKFCVSCGNKRRPQMKAVWDWNESRIFINRVERTIREQRKNNIATS